MRNLNPKVTKPVTKSLSLNLCLKGGIEQLKTVHDCTQPFGAFSWRLTKSSV